MLASFNTTNAIGTLDYFLSSTPTITHSSINDNEGIMSLIESRLVLNAYVLIRLLIFPFVTIYPYLSI